MLAPVGALYLSDSDVRSLLDPRAILEVIESTFLDAYRGQIAWSQPRALRLNLDQPAPAKYHVKAAALPELGVAGVRVVGYRVFPDGSGTSRDDNMRYVLLHDTVSGQPLAIVDEHTSYGVRSASSGVVAAKYLARPESAVVGLVGAGKLMRSALVALATVFPLREVRVTSRSPESRARFAQEMSPLAPGVQILPVETPAAACREADIVMSATTAFENLIFERHLAPGVFVCGLGQHEVAPDAFEALDKVVVDDWEQVGELADFKAMAESGVFDRSKVYAELRTIVAGVTPGRTSAEERILARTEGLVNQDLAVSFWLYQQAVKAGLGLRLP